LDRDEVSTTNFGKECTAASSVSGDRGEEHRANQSGKRRECGSVCSSTSSQKRGRRWEKERTTDGLWIATARWRPACTRGHRGACAGGHRSRGYCGGQRVDRRVERGSMRWTAATARRRPGEALCRRRQCRSRGAEGGAEEEERRERSRDLFANFKSYRDPAEKYFFPLI
jgi:hypothetical protein